MDRLGRNLDDLRKLVLGLTERGVRVEFRKENLIFAGKDPPMANLLLSVMGAIEEFERQLIRERQREGIAIAKNGAYITAGQQPQCGCCCLARAEAGGRGGTLGACASVWDLADDADRYRTKAVGADG